MNYAALEKVFACPNLPTLPAVAMKVLELTNKPDVQLKEVAAVIEHDQAIATKVLRTINSSFYGLSRRCGSIQQALALLGLQTVKGLVLGFSLAKSLDGGGDKDVSFDFMTYWRRCMYCAAAARHIAVLTRRCDPDEAFVAALVQDVGMVALWRAFGDRYLQTVDSAGKDHRRLCGLERKALEVDHAAVAGEMTRRWRFPEPIIEAVRAHHNSGTATLEAMQIARTVELAGMASTVILAESTKPDEAVNRFRTAANEWFDIKNNMPLTLLQVFSDKAQELARVFSLNVGETPDIEAILAEAEKTRNEQSLPAMNVDEILAAESREACDEVTGLPDKSVFIRDIDAAFAQLPKSGTGVGIGVIIALLDDAKSLNTTHSPDAGDVALKRVGEVVGESLGRFGRAYRFVGAGVVGLLPKIDLEQLCRVAESARKRVAESVVRLDREPGHVTVSCGAAICEGDESAREASGITTRDQLLKSALVAASMAQQTKNKVVLYRKDTARAAA
ncbi:MAG: HDOD domain-containing protein [Phycisphaerae bacterium]|jgi:two-component system cell cycle response regulator|nr:HDOD domain-containing protein [Phycisphaerae bacterium]